MTHTKKEIDRFWQESDMRRAEATGYADYGAGVPFERCPYHPVDWVKAWRRGWLQASKICEHD